MALFVAVTFAALLRITCSTCPNVEDLKPCSCLTLHSYKKIECQRITSEEKLRTAVAPFRGTDVFEFELALCAWAQVPSDIFNNIHVSELYTYMVNYSSAAGAYNPYESLDERLYMIEIKHGHCMDEFNWTSMHKLTSLQRVYIFNSNLVRIGPEFSTMPQSLTHFMVQGGDLEVIEEGAFAGLQLRDLDVSYTKLAKLSRKILPAMADNLRVLSLRNNMLSTLPDDMFTNMPNLNLLDLSTNQIMVLSDKVLKPVLQRMHLLDISKASGRYGALLFAKDLANSTHALDYRFRDRAAFERGV